MTLNPCTATQGSMHSDALHPVRPARTRRRANCVSLPASGYAVHGAKQWMQPVGRGQVVSACCLPEAVIPAGLDTAQMDINNSSSSRRAGGLAARSVDILSQEARDEHFMHAALEQAAQGRALGEVPVGAVLVSGDGEVLSAAQQPHTHLLQSSGTC
ncbi:hypothetical protein DUNSADRAFT_11723 [Dunaliella salina]|uniref:CMP/dCMP-type deaminase domain-containing protein n=1 Tax=Dunaliella salina TaxID=3046 RepID=A0ABQ7GCQ2_DUNSA|nr:hypothetical protein DUNSADRAFT_11723 [Dunaliella salina]|eukprot:KAF5832391.1 hypothetical protein DUNSADRAFT_11723 [Dunaliella salina]